MKIMPNSDIHFAPDLFMSRCYNREHCTQNHTIATYAEVEEITSLLSKFIKNPKGPHKGR